MPAHALPEARPLRLSVRPDPATCPNPYLRLFYGALAPSVELGEPLVVNDAWLRARASELDAVHFHWPESIWRPGSDPSGSRRRVAGLARFLRLAGSLGIRRIWTVHNVVPHEHRRALDYVGCFTVARMADLLICHSEEAARAVRRWFRPSGEIVVMPIGNYAGVYPQPRTRSEVLQEIGLDPARPLVACLGDVRPYKGLDVAIDALQNLAGTVQAVIGGQPLGDAETARQLARAGALPATVVLPRRVTDQEFADYAAAADLLWLPYHRVTGSSVLLAALTLGVPVVASDLPFFRQILAGHRAAGRLVPPGDAAALATATTELLGRPPAEARRAALALAARYEWRDVIRPVAAVLERWRSRR